jgi:hypothetical protein
MDQESEFNGLPSIEMVEMQVMRRAARIKVPPGLLPALGRMEEGKHHFVSVGEIYYHYVFYNRGEEVSRLTTERLDELLYWVFRDATFEMASAAHPPGSSPDFRVAIFESQQQLMTELKPSWTERLHKEIERVLTHSPFPGKSPVARKLSLRHPAPRVEPPAEGPADAAVDI